MILSHKELYDAIHDALLDLDGCCLDNDEERTRVAHRVQAKILDFELDVLSGVTHDVSRR